MKSISRTTASFQRRAASSRALLLGAAVLAIVVAAVTVYSIIKGAGAGNPQAPGGALNAQTVEKPDKATSAALSGKTDSDSPGSRRPDATKKNDKATSVVIVDGRKQIKVRVVWKEGGAGIPDVALSAAKAGPWIPETTGTVKTGTDGWAKLLFPVEWNAISIKAVHPEIVTQYSYASTPPATEHVIKAERGATVFGKVFLDENKRPAAKAQVWAANARDAVTTAGEDGAYEITGLPDGFRQIFASLGAQISNSGGREPVPVEVKSGQRIGPYDLYLGTGLSLSGAVRDLDGNQPIANAEISQSIYDPRGMGAQGPRAKSGPDGAFRLEGLPIGRVSVMASAAGYVSESATVQITSGALNICEMALEPGSTVTVRVVDTTSAPMANAQLVVYGSRFERMRGQQNENKTDAKGEAVLNGISVHKPPQISAYKENYSARTPARPVFEPGSRSAEVKITLYPSTRKTPQDDPTSKSEVVVAFKGRVTNSQNEPVAGAKVYWGYRYNPETGDPALTDSDGAYRLEAKKELTGSQSLSQITDHVLAVYAKGYATAAKKQISGGTAEAPMTVDFKLSSGHWIGGTVVNGKGEPLAGLQVGVNVQNTSGEDDIVVMRQPQARELRTNAEGKFRQEDLPKRIIMVSISGKGWSNYNKEIPLDQETRIVMKERGVIKGRVVEAAGEAPVKFFTAMPLDGSYGPFGDQAGIQFHANDGAFILYDLQQDQKYTIQVQARGYSPARQGDLTAAAEAEALSVLFKLSKTVETKGVVFDAADQKPIAGAEVQLFENMDGSEFGGRSFMRHSWGGDAENENMTRTDKNGAFTIQEAENAGFLLVRAENYASLSIAPDDRSQYGEAHSLRIGLKRGGAIRGTITSDGKPAPNVSVSVIRSYNDSGQWNPAEQRANQGMSVQTDENGAYKISALRAGNYTLNVSKYESGAGINRSVKCEIADGEEKVLDIALDGGKCALYGRILKGQTPIPEANLSIYPRRGGGSSRQTQSKSNGEYRIEGIEEGVYNVNIYVRNEAGNNNFSEEVEISGELQRDFVMPERRKVMMKVVFDGVTDPDKTPRVTNANLNIKHDSAVNTGDRKGIDSYSYCNSPVDNQLVFQSRLKGEYSINLGCRTNDKSSFNYNASEPLKLDNLEADQDLGEIHVQYGGASSLKGFVFDLGGKPIKEASVSLSPAEGKGGESLSYSAATGDQGRYEIQGMTDGAYNARVSKQGQWRPGGSQDSMQMSEKVAINGATEHDFILLSNFKVTARFVLPPNQTDVKLADLRSPSIRLNSSGDGQSNAMLQIGSYGNGAIDRKGQVTFTGRYLGKYSMNVQVKNSSTEIPAPFQLDNLDHDQDLGEITLPGMNFMRLRLTCNLAPGVDRPEYGQIVFTGEKIRPGGGASRFYTNSSFNAAKDENIVGPVPEGTNRVSLQINGWKASPEFVPISITPGQPLEAAFTLTPSSHVRGYVNIPSEAGKGGAGIPSRIMLSGPGGERMLIPKKYSEASPNELWSGRDAAVGREFAFWDVPDGLWRLTVEAEGCQPETREVRVKLGAQTDQINVQMKRKQ
ncbi:MAG: carboxypeptidase-like regulatory domain-containing protein [Candidatus Sumerlaeota bacterium]|nr:carboxypeptidase-like regulatory domain-containing protein [Candidatus Sumerlaeota bacterium]